MIGLIVLLINHLNKKKIGIILGSLSAIFLSMPLWASLVLEKLGTTQQLLYAHSKYSALHLPLDFTNPLFPYWISIFVSIGTASFLIFNNKYRILGVIVLVFAIVHILALSEELAFEYTFFHKSLRSTGLLFYISISLNLIAATVIAKNLSVVKKITKNKSLLIKSVLLISIFLILLPGYQLIESKITPTTKILDIIPGGNERNLQFWLYQNSSKDDKILNDLSIASAWYLGFRAQPLLNSDFAYREITKSYDENLKSYKPQFAGSKETLLANEILKHPWDYDENNKIIDELGIDYIYLSERQSITERCKNWKVDSPSCYPTSDYLTWHNYSGSSRIAMYENWY
jgi:predicted nucleic acid-binding protein